MRRQDLAPALRDATRRSGEHVLADPAAFARMLTDVAPDIPPPVRHLLERAVQAGVVAQLRSGDGSPEVRHNAATRLAEVLRTDDPRWTPAAAEWAVAVLAVAAGFWVQVPDVNPLGGTQPPQPAGDEQATADLGPAPDQATTPREPAGSPRTTLVLGVVGGVAALVLLATTVLLVSGRDDDPAEAASPVGEPSTALTTSAGSSPSSTLTPLSEGPGTPLTVLTEAPAAEVPAPFDSPELTRFATAVFPASRCRDVRPGEAPIQDTYPDAELVLCSGGRYEAILMRKRVRSELLPEERLLLGEALAGSVRQATGGPMARTFDAVYAYLHRSSSSTTARVYWRSNRCRCIGIVRAPDDDVTAAISYWSSAQGRSG